ncbi:MAG TPA: ABC transporter substrate binding protein [Bryobacteraceae bacterium]|nr:ABC transporter substrate binding protein [Bryobacteraceae bacterium]
MRARVYVAVVMALNIVHRRADALDTPARIEQATVVIVTSSAVEAFEEAVRGIQRGLGPAVKAVVVDLKSQSRPPANLANKEIRLLITVGNHAFESAAQSGTAPILATMLLRSDLAGTRLRAPSDAVALDVPLGDILARMTSVLPGKTRAAIIRNPDANSVPQATLIAQAKAAGMTLKVLDCPRPEKLLQLFLSLRGQVDFVVCPPDGTLYNSTTVRPLILASLENRLPVIGFSESFVRSGALAAVYPDYFDVGSQTGELARNYLAGANQPLNEKLRKLKVAANPRVARLLGLRIPGRNDSESGIVVIE